MLIEEIFGTDIPDRDAEGLGTQVETWIGLKVTFPIDDATSELLLASEH